DHWVLRVLTPAGAAEFMLYAAGRHNVRNALAAAAAALAIGAPLVAVVQGLEAFRPVAGRSQVSSLQRGERRITLVNDSYNANPDSVRAAIDLLATLAPPQWLLLGDMGEVGDQGPAFHAEVGAHARATGIAALWAVGAQSIETARAYGPGARHFDRVESLIGALDEAPDCASVLVKGSRFMAMERVVAALQAGGGHAV
ncbi:MAG: UDP-N-acetylmuramoylalanyl-D-glutamyl-2, 6-diaminopimelate--D-alanyl-D-alanine ligase, partial [Burkholderiales bacterium]|nr:UDP-N-acetylmuramoylalanyl-D-glutamyl-2, 6-diaminopimelate--D-alanyl-D-alanine ligase [Burkholderiales bacterium]